jgi:cobalt/nickel transport protein
MRLRVGFLLSLLALNLCASWADAHYPMLLLSSHSVKRGESVTLTYQWGHPYEHQLFDALVPKSLWVLCPDGKRIDLTADFKKTTVPAGDDKTVSAFQTAFAPKERGDYIFCLELPPVWMADDREYLEDLVFVVLHVQAQRGWDSLFAPVADHPSIRPLTRPYGLLPGAVFQALVSENTKPLADVLVEFEHYNETPPKDLPPDEQITRAAKADPNGVVTCTLADAGWTCIAAIREKGKMRHEEKEFPVRQRAVFWVYVDTPR